MPANKNAVVRYQKLDELLSDRHHHYTMEDITEKVNKHLVSLGYSDVTRRCLEKDIVFMQERPFCAPIQRFQSNGFSCIRYARRNFTIFNKELTKEEESLLAEVINTIGQFEGLPNFGWLSSLQEQLGLEKHEQIIHFSSAVKLKNSHLLASLFDVIVNEQVISIVYHRFDNDIPETLIVHPYSLREYNKRWYLVCYDETRNFICTLALDRINDFEPIPEKKLVPSTEEIKHRFDNSIGITVLDDTPPMYIIFWVSDHEAKYIDTKKMHNSQEELREEVANDYRERYQIPEGGRFFSLFCQDTYELRRELCSHFGELLVIEPPILVKEISDDLENMMLKYSTIYNKV